MINEINGKRYITKFRHDVSYSKEDVENLKMRPNELVGGTFCTIKEVIPGKEKEDYPIVAKGRTFLVVEDMFHICKIKHRKTAFERALLGITMWFDPKKGKAIPHRDKYSHEVIKNPIFSKEERAEFWKQYMNEHRYDKNTNRKYNKGFIDGIEYAKQSIIEQTKG